MNTLASDSDGIELLYRGSNLDNVAFESITDYNNFAKELEIRPISDIARISKEFNIPQHYKDIDVAEYVYSKISASGQDVKRKRIVSSITITYIHNRCNARTQSCMGCRQRKCSSKFCALYSGCA